MVQTTEINSKSEAPAQTEVKPAKAKKAKPVVLAFDVANRTMQMTDGKKTSRIISVKRFLGKDAEMYFGTDTKFIRHQSGTEVGSTWQIGEQAAYFDSSVKTYTESKPDVCRDFFLAMMQDFSKYQTIDTLKVIDSAPEAHLIKYRRALEGIHHWTYKNKKGQEIERTLTVKNIETVQEGQGAVNLYLKEHQAKKPFVVVYNFGGNTKDGLVFDSFGRLIPQYRKNFNGKGAVDLVNRIGQRLRQYQMITFDATPEELFSALENDGKLDGVYIYDVAKEVGKEWLSETHKSYCSTIAGIYKQVDKYILTGGLAHLFTEAFKDHAQIYVTPNPSTDNLAVL